MTHYRILKWQRDDVTQYRVQSAPFRWGLWSTRYNHQTLKGAEEHFNFLIDKPKMEVLRKWP